MALPICARCKPTVVLDDGSECCEVCGNVVYQDLYTVVPKNTSSFTVPQNTSSFTDDESDGLSDIDDVEVSGYLNNEEEMRYKKIIWEEMNKEYRQEHAAAAAAKMEAAAVAKSRKERKRKQDVNPNPAQTTAESAHQMLIKKRLNSKINYDVLETLFADKPASDTDKKVISSNGDDNGTAKGQNDGEKEHDGDRADNIYDELEQGYEDMEQEDGNVFNFENEENGYGYGYGYDYDNGEDEY
ncbi:uncharacterized protein LOC132192306 [Corylus avellana]|uniref:uncharacterized protein LOC132192306 n=1 Tax=Corylus avellana TaxID=13451 RepID=UPI002869FF36|nr:uncharacterized protein LOC132192306 [Corylus avellana]